MVDIVVICYNQAAYINQCLDSIAHQSCSSWNLYVVDDCSSDNSVDVFNKWLKDNKITAHRQFNQQNMGACKTLNAVIPALRSPFVKFIAADDYLEPGYLEEVLSAFNNSAENTALVHTNADYVFDNQQQPAPGANRLLHSETIASGNIKSMLFRQNVIAALTVMMRTDVLRKIGGFNELVLIDDYDMWLRMAVQELSMVYVDKVLASYRVHGGNISQKKKDLLDLQSVMCKIKYDAAGEFAKYVHADLLDVYNRFGNDADKLQQIKDIVLPVYAAYPGCSKLLYYFINKKVPYSLFRFLKPLM